MYAFAITSSIHNSTDLHFFVLLWAQSRYSITVLLAAHFSFQSFQYPAFRAAGRHVVGALVAVSFVGGKDRLKDVVVVGVQDAVVFLVDGHQLHMRKRRDVRAARLVFRDHGKFSKKLIHRPSDQFLLVTVALDGATGQDAQQSVLVRRDVGAVGVVEGGDLVGAHVHRAMDGAPNTNFPLHDDEQQRPDLALATKKKESESWS